jgi:hypothetical protein
VIAAGSGDFFAKLASIPSVAVVPAPAEQYVWVVGGNGYCRIGWSDKAEEEALATAARTAEPKRLTVAVLEGPIDGENFGRSLCEELAKDCLYDNFFCVDPTLILSATSHLRAFSWRKIAF